MDLRQYISLRKPTVHYGIPLANIILLFIFMALAAAFLSGGARMMIRLPGAVTSDIADHDSVTIIVSSENIFFHGNKVVSLDEIKALLSDPLNRSHPLLIKAARRASVGRIADLWNLARNLGVERVDVASDRED